MEAYLREILDSKNKSGLAFKSVGFVPSRGILWFLICCMYPPVR
nr:hypothetical protein [Enterobacter hormaechei]